MFTASKDNGQIENTDKKTLMRPSIMRAAILRKVKIKMTYEKSVFRNGSSLCLCPFKHLAYSGLLLLAVLSATELLNNGPYKA